MLKCLLVLSLSFISFVHGSTCLQSPDDVAAIFPKTTDQIEEAFQLSRNQATSDIQRILDIPAEQRTFENTVLAYDNAVAKFRITGRLLSTLQKVHPDAAIREKAEEALVSFNDMMIDLFATNQDIYRLFKAQNLESLNDERRFYLTQAVLEFQREGLELDPEKFQEMKQLQKQIALLSLQFQSNISQDQSTIRFTKKELQGLSDDFIGSLKSEGGKYILRCDYPTALQVRANCALESTRRDYIHAFHNRAYPQNLEVLKELIAARDSLARVLGYQNYAELDIASEMAKTPERVDAFLTDQAAKVHPMIKRNWQLLFQELPKSVTLTADGKIKAWDVAYVNNHYFKKHFKVDHEKIAEYFPADRTIRSILDIYETFLSLKFRIVASKLWDPSVQLVEVRKGQNLIGYLILDLYPRAYKYSHACCSCIITPSENPALVAIITNFSKPSAGKPALLKHREVKTFFHELGHAVHALLGKAEMPTKAAYHTTTDFVEAPSQLLEEWTWDREILKMISHHYQSGKALPDAMIDGLLRCRGFGDAAHVATSSDGDCAGTSVLYSRLSLNLFKGTGKDPARIEKELYETTPQIVAYDPDLHFLCAFGHLSGYGAKYYSYLWSKQIAFKIFDYIKSHGGLLDPAMGQRYILKVIGRGGSCDPEQLVADFLNVAK